MPLSSFLHALTLSQNSRLALSRRSFNTQHLLGLCVSVPRRVLTPHHAPSIVPFAPLMPLSQNSRRARPVPLPSFPLLLPLMAASVTRRSELRKVKFGTSDMHVSELCVGSMTWGSYISDEAAAHAQLDAAFAAGALARSSPRGHPPLRRPRTCPALPRRLPSGPERREPLCCTGR